MLAKILTMSALIFLGTEVLAQDTKFEKDSETAIEETKEVKDGKTVRKVRAGKVQTREGEPRVGDINDSEITQIKRRQESLNLTSFGFGPFWSNNLGKGEMMYGASYGYHWEVSTTGEIVAEVTGGTNDKGRMINGGIGFNFIPMTTSVSPLVGAQFGMGYGKGKDEDGVVLDRGGFSIQGNLGLRMFRLATTQLEVISTYTALLSKPTPYIFGLQVRVLW
jgi:hypothetical protein